MVLLIGTIGSLQPRRSVLLSAASRRDCERFPVEGISMQQWLWKSIEVPKFDCFLMGILITSCFGFPIPMLDDQLSFIEFNVRNAVSGFGNIQLIAS